MRLDLDEDRIKELYLEGRSSIEIGRIMKCHGCTIIERLKGVGVKIRSGGEAKRLSLKKYGHPLWLGLNEEKIRELYSKGHSSKDIGEIIGCDGNTIIKRLKKMGVKIRNRNEARKLSLKKHIHSMKGKHHTEEAIEKMKKAKLRNPTKYWLNKKRNDMEGGNHPMYVNLEPYKDEIIKLYEKGLSSLELARRFKGSVVTILDRLNKWEIPIRNPIYGTRKERIITENGEKLRSTGELIIWTFFFSNKIPYIYEKKMGYRNYKCDFCVLTKKGEIFIEYWGLMKNKKYDEKTEKKIQIYKKLGLNLISIFPKDNIQEKLKFLIPICSKTQKTLDDFR